MDIHVGQVASSMVEKARELRKQSLSEKDYWEGIAQVAIDKLDNLRKPVVHEG